MKGDLRREAFLEQRAETVEECSAGNLVVLEPEDPVAAAVAEKPCEASVERGGLDEEPPVGEWPGRLDRLRVARAIDGQDDFVDQGA